MAGRRGDAEKLIDELKDLSKRRYVSAHAFTWIHLGLGDKDRAFEWLEKAFGYHSFTLATMRISPLLEPLRDDPRWKDLAHRIGVPQ